MSGRAYARQPFANPPELAETTHVGDEPRGGPAGRLVGLGEVLVPRVLKVFYVHGERVVAHRVEADRDPVPPAAFAPQSATAHSAHTVLQG
ncbi:hypothetical protein GCM10018773_24660 [Streptomyces candidus]|nr:hypothetical protein GCM10018773_24660 [Streptomyces candidus]